MKKIKGSEYAVKDDNGNEHIFESYIPDYVELNNNGTPESVDGRPPRLPVYIKRSIQLELLTRLRSSTYTNSKPTHKHER